MADPVTTPQAATDAAVRKLRSECDCPNVEDHAYQAVEAAAPLIRAAYREEILAVLRRAAAGKREYASRGGPDDITALMEMAAFGYESAADLITDPRHILDVIPSWQWTEAERASLYEKDGA